MLNINKKTIQEGYELYQLTADGKRPYLVCSDRGVNILDKLVIEHNMLAKKRNKTPEDYQRLYRLEFEINMYYDPKFGPFVPEKNIRKLLIEGARFHKKGKHMERALAFHYAVGEMQGGFPLLYKGPKTIDGLWGGGTSGFIDIRTVVVGNKQRINRCRPIFLNWGFTASIILNTTEVSEEEFVMAVNMAGSRVGLGQLRPVYGLFNAEISKATIVPDQELALATA